MAQVGSISPDARTDIVSGSSVYMVRTEIQSFFVNADVNIVAGDWVAIDIAQSGNAKSNAVIPAEAVADGNALVIGVALDSTVAAPDGYAVEFSQIRVCTAGYCAVAKVTASIVAGVALIVGSGAAATGEVAAATDLTRAIGATLAADSGATGFAPVCVYKA